MFHCVIISNEHKYETFLCDLEEGDVLLNQPKVKMALERKKLRAIVESLHISICMVMSYHRHFGIDFKNKR
jgi:hypothetical protein